MPTRAAAKNIATKTAEHLTPKRLGGLKTNVKAAADVVNKDKAALKAALSVAKSPGAGDSSAKAAVSGGLTALKEVGGRMFGKKGKGAGRNKVKITNIIEDVDIGAPRRLVYNQWTQFQDFPSFTKKVQSTEQVANEKLQWKAKIFWSTRMWESTIVEQVPDERIVWTSKGTKGYVNGVATFHELSPDLTRVLLVLEYHPQGLFEKTGNLWRAQGRRARLELKHFRRHVMTQALLAKPDEVEGWRGEIHDSEVVKTHEDAVADEKKQRGGNTRKQEDGGSTTRSRKSASASSGSQPSGARRSSGTKRSSASGRSSRGKQSSSSSGSRQSSGSDEE
jgi:uncharacterized membrane protein